MMFHAPAGKRSRKDFDPLQLGQSDEYDNSSLRSESISSSRPGISWCFSNSIWSVCIASNVLSREQACCINFREALPMAESKVPDVMVEMLSRGAQAGTCKWSWKNLQKQSAHTHTDWHAAFPAAGVCDNHDARQHWPRTSRQVLHYPDSRQCWKCWCKFFFLKTLNAFCIFPLFWHSSSFFRAAHFAVYLWLPIGCERVWTFVDHSVRYVWLAYRCARWTNLGKERQRSTARI